MVEQDTFGTLLRELREENDLTQSAVGEAIGYHASTVSRLESGEIPPDLQTAASTCEALRLNVAAKDRLMTAAGQS